jgi:membrane protein DedA with SNARE-associated domain
MPTTSVLTLICQGDLMMSSLGVAELPLAILAWMLASLIGASLLFLLVVAVLAAISEYAEHKQKIKWDKITRGVRR